MARPVATIGAYQDGVEPIFGAFAAQYVERGLRVFPTGGDDGKRPLVKWGRFRKGQSEKTVARLTERFPNENIGIITGLKHGITVIDVDEPSLAPDVIARCGDTPLKIRTPRGGFHLLYHARGEKNVQALDGARVDVRGVGGFINAPPSRRPGFDQPYEVVDGSLADLDRLPTVNAGSLPLHRSAIYKPCTASDDPTKCWAGLVEGDGRNRELFHQGLGAASKAATDAELLSWALKRNTDFAEPMPEDEVRKLVDSLWRYREAGKLIPPGMQAAIVDLDDIQTLIGNADALALWTFLKARHWKLRPEFIITPKALAASFCWARKRIEKARDHLIAGGFLVRTHTGGRKNNPHRYAFGPSDLRGSN